jgi:hypothetical protein
MVCLQTYWDSEAFVLRSRMHDIYNCRRILKTAARGYTIRHAFSKLLLGVMSVGKPIFSIC